MMRYIYRICTIIFLIYTQVLLVAQALEVVYPKTKFYTTTSDKTFFIGNSQSALKINGNSVPTHKSGGFLYPVKLDLGENRFNISDDNENLEYIILRNKVQEKKESTQVLYYKNAVVVEVKENNTPLRITPADTSFNRLQNFKKGMRVLAIGEYGDFYKIKLNRDDYAWISKKKVFVTKYKELKNAQILDYTFEQIDSNRQLYKIKLTNKVPYTLYDNKGLDLAIYNVDGVPYNKYELRFEKLGNIIGFNSYYTDNNELVIDIKTYTLKNKTKPLQGLKITVDAGHGGSEYGAIGCLGNKEKDTNLQIALKLAEKLKDSGAEVFLTRDKDVDVSLNDRVIFANKNDTDIFLSIHNNAAPDEKADFDLHGTSIYYFYPQSKLLAKTLLKAITTQTDMKDKGVTQESFAVIRNSQALSVLIELGYIISPEDDAKLVDTDYQKKLVNSIVNGLERYFNEL